MAVSLKPGVKFEVESLGLARILASVLICGRVEDLVITSGSDGKHAPNSRHYKGEAVDIRTSNLKDRAATIDRLKRTLGPMFTVLDEGDHLHVQVKKGMTY